MNRDNDFNEENDLDPEESLRLDNQLKRLELELAGAKFIEHNPEGIELPPDVEAQMLDHILSFEKLKKQVKEVPLFEYLNKPKFKPLEDLTEEELIKEKDRLLKIFKRKGITLSSILPVADRDMYRFMTNEFLQIPTLDMPLKGFVRHFIYEEFHPNDELNVMQSVHAMFHFFFQEGQLSNSDLYLMDNVRDYLEKFLEYYVRFENFEAELVTKTIKKRVANLVFKTSWDAYMENTLKTIRFEGETHITLRTKDKIWMISDLRLPMVQ